MRVETNSNDTGQCWMTEREYDRLTELADEQTTLALRLGAECGLRHAESAAVTPGDITEAMVDLDDDVLQQQSSRRDERVIVYWLEVHGKDTTGGTKRRDAFVPEDVHRDLELAKHKRNLDPGQPFIDASPRTLRRWISSLGEDMADQTGNDDWRYFSSHDLRRYFATRCLQIKGMNPEVVMEVGGWSSYSALRPYLQSPIERVIAAEFAAADML